MDLRKTLDLAVSALKNSKIDHALIGGFALAHYGVMRATQDIDLLVDGSNAPQVKSALTSQGFKLFHENENILQFTGPGYLDVVLAKRHLSLEMIKQSSLSTSLNIKIVKPEAIIGLKIQALTNDPDRELQDLADIKSLIDEVKNLDWNLIKKYADLFEAWEKIKTFKK